MIAEAAASDAVARARRTPGLRVGLHVVVVDGRTVLSRDQLRSIVDSSGRLSDRLVAAGFRFFFLRSGRRALRAEIRAQLEAFRATGLKLNHVDTHRHMVLHPTVLSAIIDLAPEFGVQAVRLPAEPWRATRGLPFHARAGAAVRLISFAPLLGFARWRLRRAGIRYNAEVRGLTDTGAMDEATVLRLITTVDRDLTEIFFHPATATPTAIPLPQPLSRHLAELKALCSPAVRTALELRGAELIGFGDLSASRPGSSGSGTPG
jgi:hopanoid biosynthesis associated protein HpnK